MTLRRALALAAPLLLLACHEDRRGKSAHDDSACDSGPAQDSGHPDEPHDDVPAACGSGTWGNLDTDENTIYVDISAAEGGAGNASAPFTSIQAGLDAAGDADGGMVAVAAGTYPETLELGRGHDDVRLAGRCKELVIIDASAGDEQTAGIHMDAKSSELAISGVTVSTAHDVGLRVYSGILTIRDSRVEGSEGRGIAAFQSGLQETILVVEACEVVENSLAGVLSHGAGTTVTLRETVIQGTRSDEKGLWGFGIEVYSGASLQAESSEVIENRFAGLIADATGTKASLHDTIIRDTKPDENGSDGYGIAVCGGASLETEACEVSGNTAVGVIAMDAGTSISLHETTIQDTQREEDGWGGYGIVAKAGANLEADSCELLGNAQTGVAASGADTTVALRQTTIQDTQPVDEGTYGYGIQVSDGANLETDSCELAGNTGLGVGAMDSGSSVSLRGTTVRDTQPVAGGDGGFGIQVVAGASLTAETCEVARNTGGGVVADGSSTTVTLGDTTIDASRRGEVYTLGAGIIVQKAATVEATDIEVCSNDGPGLYITYGNSLLTCSQCALRDNGFSGAVVIYGGSLVLADSIIEGTTAQENIGGGIGLYAEPREAGRGPSMEITNTTIQDNPIAGVWLTDEGSFAFTGNSIHGGAGWTRESLSKCGDAVYARDGITSWDGSTGLLLQDNQILDSRGAGLFLDKASATLSGNSYGSNAVDLVTQGADCATPPVGYEEESLGSAELCPTYDYATCGDEFMLFLELAEPESGYGAALAPPGTSGPDALRLLLPPTAHTDEP